MVRYTVNPFTSTITFPLISQALEGGHSSIYSLYTKDFDLMFSVYTETALTSSPVAQLQGMCFDSSV